MKKLLTALLLLLIIFLTSIPAFALDATKTTGKDLATRKKVNMLVIGHNLSRRIRTEVDAGVYLNSDDPNSHSTVGISFEYAFIQNDEYSINVKTGIHMDAYLYRSATDRYTTFGFSYVRPITRNTFHVIEISRKLERTDQWQTGAGTKYITGIRHTF